MGPFVFAEKFPGEDQREKSADGLLFRPTTAYINPDTLDWTEGRPESTRPYLERLVADDRARHIACAGLPS